MELGKFILTLCTLFGFIITIKASSEECDCGWTNPSPDRIVGGFEPAINELPMMAVFYTISGEFYFCGGTVITNKHILTAGSCFLEAIEFLEDILVVLGEHNGLRTDDTNVTRNYTIEKVMIHPKYKENSYEYDIAVVQCINEFEFSMYVGPACLPFNYIYKDFVGETVTLAGWGLTKTNGNLPKILRKVDVKVISNDNCTKVYGSNPENSICTYAWRRGICTFDTGGPVLWRNGDSDHYINIGVIGYEKECVDRNPNIHIRIDSYMDFILSSTPDYEYCKLY